MAFIRLLILLLFAAPVSAQGTIIRGGSVGEIYFAPNPQSVIWAGTARKDQFCEVYNDHYDVPGPIGPQNTLTIQCFAVPESTTNRYNVIFRMRPMKNGVIAGGYELGIEGKWNPAAGEPEDTGIEAEHFYLWMFDKSPEGGRTLLSHSRGNNGQYFDFGEQGKPLSTWISGGTDSGWISSRGDYWAQDGPGTWYLGITKTGICQRFVRGLCVQ